jgi:Na+/proline symporter
MDLYHRHMRPDASQRRLIAVGRGSTVVFLLLAWAWAPFLVSFERIFSYIQEFWGLITPGVAVVFLSGLFWKKATARGAVWVMGLTLPVTIGVKWATPDAAFLDQMWIAGIALFLMLAAISLVWPEEGAASASGQMDAAAQQAGARPGSPPARGDDATESTGSRGGKPVDPFQERDLLFDVLSIGAVVATVALVLFFW